MHPDDAGRLGLGAGDTVRLTTRRGSVAVSLEVNDTMQPGFLSLPNGLGLSGPDTDSAGVAPNELTSLAARDPFAHTPWHKYVPARVEAS
jgi:anaerobic selenocysteine-containing dehydrogenase